MRVDLFAERRDPRQQYDRIAKALRALLPRTDDDARAGIGIDGGTGVADRPVVGLLFWVRADDVGEAANIAVETARKAGASAGAGPELYDVVVIPRNSVVMPDDPGYPRMPD